MHCIAINTRHVDIYVNAQQNGETNKGTSSKCKGDADENLIMVVESKIIERSHVIKVGNASDHEYW